MADVNIKKLNEFTTATLSDSLLVPLSNASGTGYKATMSAVRDYVSADTSYYVCGSNADASAKSVTATGFNLRTGGAMHIKFTYANEADDVTLNVGGTGAYPLMLNGTRASSTNLWAAGDVFDLYFDGTNWQATSADAAIESKFADVMEEIEQSKQEALDQLNEELQTALDEIAEAIEGLNLYYDVI